MMIGNYKFAEECVSVKIEYEETRKLFSIFSCTEPGCILLSADEYERRSKKKEAKEYFKKRVPFLSNRIFPEYELEVWVIIDKLNSYLITKDVLPFHASVLKIDGSAYLVTGPSGAGKSTHARLWKEQFGDDVTIINDDKPLLKFLDSDNGIIAYSSPIGGIYDIKENTSAPVKGIIYLSHGKENHINRLTETEAYPLLFGRCHRIYTKQYMPVIMQMIYRLSQLPVFSLSCTVSEEAVLMAYRALKNGIVS